MDNARLAAGQLARAGDAHVTGIVKITDNENQSSGIYYRPSPTHGSACLGADSNRQPAVNVQSRDLLTGQLPGAPHARRGFATTSRTQTEQVDEFEQSCGGLRVHRRT